MQLPVGLRQRLAGQPGGEAGVEVGALGDVLVGAAEPVADGFAGGLRAGDLLVKLRELALRELPPAGRAAAPCDERLLFGEGEPRVAVEQNGGDKPGRRFRVTALAGNPGRRGEQAAFFVVAQGRGGGARPAGQLADGEQAAGRVDFRCA